MTYEETAGAVHERWGQLVAGFTENQRRDHAVGLLTRTNRDLLAGIRAAMVGDDFFLRKRAAASTLCGRGLAACLVAGYEWGIAANDLETNSLRAAWNEPPDETSGPPVPLALRGVLLATNSVASCQTLAASAGMAIETMRAMTQGTLPMRYGAAEMINTVQTLIEPWVSLSLLLNQAPATIFEKWRQRTGIALPDGLLT